ncbi:MAG TPA: hypothetical protein VGE07_10435 [Herpetosiphonaceae bacterium]
MKRWLITILGCGLLLAGCAAGPLLSEVAVSAREINLATGPRTTQLSYRIGEQALVSVWLEDGAGARIPLRDKVTRLPSNDPYQLNFDGSVEEAGGNRRVLGDGTYGLVVRAEPEDGGAPAEQRVQVTIADAPDAAFDVFDLSVTPNPFSPDEDAIEDVANFTYRLPVTSTVSIEIIAPDGEQRFPFITREVQGPGEQRETWSGRPVVGGVLPAGVYAYQLTAEDGLGNRVAKRGDVTIISAGVGKATILEARIAPTNIELGNVITVTFRVKNTGAVPLRTHGPESGYRYNTNQSFASIEDEKWAADKGGGFWRVGLDWEGNGGAAARYPFRWALSAKPRDQWAAPGEYDLLMPGEEVEITGSVQIKQRENRMTFFVGLAHEGVDYPEDRKRQTLVLVDF